MRRGDMVEGQQLGLWEEWKGKGGREKGGEKETGR